jgi:hypothetical protein
MQNYEMNLYLNLENIIFLKKKKKWNNQEGRKQNTIYIGINFLGEKITYQIIYLM